jgi:hypothetical protein
LQTTSATLPDDPERLLTLRQTAQARNGFAMTLDEFDFVKAQLARLPTRRNQAFTPSDSRRQGLRRACSGNPLVRAVLEILPLREWS